MAVDPSPFTTICANCGKSRGDHNSYNDATWCRDKSGRVFTRKEYRMSEKTVTTTDEKVKAAAAACPTARETLKTLFPDVFEVDLTKYHRKPVIYKNDKALKGVVVTGTLATALLQDRYKEYTCEDFPLVVLHENGDVIGWRDEEAFLSTWSLV